MHLGEVLLGKLPTMSGGAAEDQLQCVPLPSQPRRQEKGQDRVRQWILSDRTEVTAPGIDDYQFKV